jgi:hypothetical protein
LTRAILSRREANTYMLSGQDGLNWPPRSAASLQMVILPMVFNGLARTENYLSRKVKTPRGPQGEKRPADAVSRALMVARIATGEIEDQTDPLP